MAIFSMMMDVTDAHTSVTMVTQPCHQPSRSQLFTDEVIQSFLRHLARRLYSIVSIVILVMVVIVVGVNNNRNNLTSLPTVVILIQCLFMALFLKFLQMLKVIDLHSWTIDKWNNESVGHSTGFAHNMWLPSFTFSVSVGIMNFDPSVGVMNSDLSLSSQTVARQLSDVIRPMITVMIAPHILCHRRATYMDYIPMLLITTGGVITVGREPLLSRDLHEVESLEAYIMTILHSVAISSTWLLLQNRFKHKQSLLTTIYYFSCYNIPQLVVCGYLTGEITPTSLDIKMSGDLLFLLLVYTVNFFCIIWCIRWNSAVTSSIIVSMVVFLTELTDFITIMGLLTYAAGIVLLLYIKISNSSKAICVQFVTYLTS